MIIYSQWNNFTCQQFAIFWIIGHNFGKYLPQKSVDKWIKKNNLKDPTKKGWLSSLQAAEIIAKEIGKKVVIFGFRDKDFMKYWNANKAIHLSLKVDTSFYRDTLDWDVDSYIHKRGQSSHAVYVIKPWILINSFGKTIPPATFDLDKMKVNWLTNEICFTIV